MVAHVGSRAGRSIHGSSGLGGNVSKVQPGIDQRRSEFVCVMQPRHVCHSASRRMSKISYWRRVAGKMRSAEAWPLPSSNGPMR